MRLTHVCSRCRTEWEAEGVPFQNELCLTCSPEFKEFKKIPRLSREMIITEKIDGTNGVIYIDDYNNLFVGSRTRWLDEHNDNFGFYKWVMRNKEALLKLGTGYHYGEWWGKGIQRGYNLQERRFSLFNVSRWKKDKEIPLLEKQEYCPDCCDVVPVLHAEVFNTEVINQILEELKRNGSSASPGFMKPEGVVVYHVAGNILFKKTIDNDTQPKSVS